MKCFTTCFQTSKYKKLKDLRNKTALKDLVQENCEESQCDKQEKEVQLIQVPIDLIAESRDEYDKQLNASIRKKVTFNVNIQIHEVTTFTTLEATTQSLVKNVDQSKEEREVGDDTISDSITSSSSFITYPPTHSLKNSRNSNVECEDMKLNESDMVDDANEGGEGDGNDNVVGDQKGWLQEEFSDSLFSISLDSKKHTFENDLEKEVSSPFKKSVHHDVLNPVDGLIQLKAIKTKATLLPSMNQTENENVNMETLLCKRANFKENEVAVDASLSSWLLDSEKTQKSKNVVGSSARDSSGSIKSSDRAKHRPVLGEIYVEEINQLSNCSSPRGGKNETPKIGTVGSYWKHTGQATSDSSRREPSITSSECRDQGEAKRNSTPFQVRLERALESVVAQDQPELPALII